MDDASAVVEHVVCDSETRLKQLERGHRLGGFPLHVVITQTGANRQASDRAPLILDVEGDSFGFCAQNGIHHADGGDERYAGPHRV